MYVYMGVGTLMFWGGYEVKRLLSGFISFPSMWDLETEVRSSGLPTSAQTLSYRPSPLSQILFLDNCFFYTCQLKIPLSVLRMSFSFLSLDSENTERILSGNIVYVESGLLISDPFFVN